jgi:hypothetical protein
MIWAVAMKSIETILTVGTDRKAVVQLPEDVTPGRHAAVVLIDPKAVAPEKAGVPLDLPVHDVGPWPTGDVTFRREDLYGDDDDAGR